MNILMNFNEFVDEIMMNSKDFIDELKWIYWFIQMNSLMNTGFTIIISTSLYKWLWETFDALMSDLLHGQQMWGHNCYRWQCNKILSSFRLLTLNQPVLSRIDKFKSLDEFIRESLDEFLEESNITNSLRNPLINSFRSGFWGSFWEYHQIFSCISSAIVFHKCCQAQF